MKNVLFLMLCVLFYSCNETKQKVVKDPALKAAIELSTKSSVKETKLHFMHSVNRQFILNCSLDLGSV